jgi:hypothetical protein
MTSVFKITAAENKTLQVYKNEAMDHLNKWFDKKWVYNTPKIFIVEDRKTIDLLKEQKSEDWVVGWSSGSMAIYILNPENISKESCHDGETYDIAKLIKHELCHSFFSMTFGRTEFSWISEGVSLYVADQLDRYRMPIEFDGFLDGKKIYQESGNAIKLLVDNFGKDKLFEFLNKQRGIKDGEELKNVFEEVFEARLDYSFFNSLKDRSSS